jgi:hypothetical protein
MFISHILYVQIKQIISHINEKMANLTNLLVPSLNGKLLRYTSSTIKPYIVGFKNERDATHAVSRLSMKPSLRVIRSCHRIADEEFIHKHMYCYLTNRVSKESIDKVKVYRGQLICQDTVDEVQPWTIERQNMLNMVRHPVVCGTGLIMVNGEAIVQDDVNTKYIVEIIDPLDDGELWF